MLKLARQHHHTVPPLHEAKPPGMVQNGRFILSPEVTVGNDDRVKSAMDDELFRHLLRASEAHAGHKWMVWHGGEVGKRERGTGERGYNSGVIQVRTRCGKASKGEEYKRKAARTPPLESKKSATTNPSPPSFALPELCLSLDIELRSALPRHTKSLWYSNFFPSAPS